MALHIYWIKRDLQFRFQAVTSRGALPNHTAYYLIVKNTDIPDQTGVGESAPLQGLSPEYGPDFEQGLEEVCRVFNQKMFPASSTSEDVLSALPLQGLPSVYFGLETALLDFKNGGDRLLFRNGFSMEGKGIPINGLVWMGDANFMRQQVREKLNQGYNCLKLKIGGLDFDTECDILKEIRQLANPADLTLRLDANGAFSPEEALAKLDRLTHFGIHSLEQPLKSGQTKAMAQVCAQSPIPIALDEELIGVTGETPRRNLIKALKPAYLILKPTLLGGFAACREWIRLGEEQGVGWWVTSALESNIGLNAVSQFVAQYGELMPQGLGTGQLYANNISSPLYIQGGHLYHGASSEWKPVADKG